MMLLYGTSRYATLIAFIVMIGLIAFPVIIASPLASTVYAQSQSSSQQQTSPPPKEQEPQTGTQYMFNNKSRPANAPEFCADYDLCDIVVYRQAPAITRNDGLVTNNGYRALHRTCIRESTE